MLGVLIEVTGNSKQNNIYNYFVEYNFIVVDE